MVMEIRNLTLVLKTNCSTCSLASLKWLNVEWGQHCVHLEYKEPNPDFQWGKKSAFFMGYESLFPFIRNFEIINLSFETYLI